MSYSGYLRTISAIEIDGKTVISYGVDEHGNPALKGKHQYPYTYDPFVLHRFGANEEANGTIYSDRMFSQDFVKHNKLCQKHFGNKGQYWDERDPKLVEALLRDWTNNPKLKLILVMEYCNIANGYPYWRFDYHN